MEESIKFKFTQTFLSNEKLYVSHGKGSKGYRGNGKTESIPNSLLFLITVTGLLALN